jgi:hypothetical protein
VGGLCSAERILAETPPARGGLAAQIAFIQQIKMIFRQHHRGQAGVVYMHHDGGTDFVAGDQGIAIMNVDLGAQERFADLGEAIAAGGHFHGDQIADGEAVVRLDQFLGGGIGVIKNEPDDGTIKALNDSEGKDMDLFAVEGGQELGERADAVFGEDGDLPNAGNVAATVYFGFFSDGRHTNMLSEPSIFGEA